MQCQRLQGVWNQNNAGGCGNHPTFGKNPAFAVKLSAETEVMIRLQITAQEIAGLGTVTDPEKFNICIGMNMYRINSNIFPLAPNTVAVSSLRHATLSTGGGHYTYNISGCVSQKTKIAAGVYIVVPATFDPGVHAQFEAVVYCQGNCMQVAKYEHTN